MKEKISRLAKGKFDYKNPQIEISPSRIELEAVRGTCVRGSFEVSSRSHVQIRAMVFSSARWMRLLTSSVTGEEAVVSYEMDASLFEAGDSAEGIFTLVSNGGEITVPFSVKIIPAAVSTGIGRISDLDQFAALARQNWEEALHLFGQEDFPDIFLHSKKNRHLYRMLAGSRDLSAAMEEFLCATYRKEAVRIHVSEEEIEYMDLQGEISGRLVIEKSEWGHVRIRVSSAGDFITLYKSELGQEDFLGSYAQLEYRILPEPGRQREGYIELSTFDETIRIPVRTCYSSERPLRDRMRRGLSDNLCALIRLLISHETGHTGKDSFQDQAREYIDGCLNHSQDPFYRILEADYLTQTGRREDAGAILDSLNERELLYQSEVNYIFYLYVNARFREDEHYTAYVRDTIQYYAQGRLRDSWQASVLLTRLVRPYGGRAARAFAGFEELFAQGNGSALLYLEAVKLANMDPSLIREAGSFQRSLFIWGMRHDVLSRDCILQYASATMRMKEFHREYMLAMMQACRIYESKDILEALLYLLVLGQCRGSSYEDWYLLGIESALRTPGLYENYMACLDLDSEPDLPYAALIYFQYDNRLPDRSKEYLYRYILQNKDQYDGIFAGYDGIIRAFVLRRLSEGAINPDLAVLYQAYLRDEALTPRVYRQLPDVMYKHMLKIGQGPERVARVIVDYEEMEQAFCYEPDENGIAYVDIFLDDYRIAFEDRQGGRHLGRIPYQLEKLLDAGKYARSCYEENPDDPRLIMDRALRALKYQMMDEDSVRIYKKAVSLDQVSDSFKRSLMGALIDYYYDTYEGETLEKYLVQADLELLDARGRSSIIEYYIRRGLFEKAYEAVGRYGYENIRLKRIMRLCSRIIRLKNFEKDDFLIQMAAYTFEKGRYDEAILNYLNRYYVGPAQKLYAIFKAAADFEVPCPQLQERFLCVAVFTETMLHEAAEVFEAYYEGRPDIRITRAFLALYSRRYLAGEDEAKAPVMRIIEIEMDQMDQARDLCELALIGYAAQSEQASQETILDAKEETARFLDRGIVFPFFAKFAGSGRIPSPLVGLSCLVCQAASGSRVRVHFEGDMPDAVMMEAAGGIYVKSFRLAPGTSVPYRITEVLEDGEREIRTGELQAPRAVGYGMDNVGNMIEMNASGQQEALSAELSAYDRFDEMAEKVFRLQ